MRILGQAPKSTTKGILAGLLCCVFLGGCTSAVPVEKEEMVVLARKIYSNGEESRIEDEREYDRSGHAIKRIWYDADGNISYWGECTYYTSGYLRQIRWWDADGSSSDSYEYRYDEAGNEIYSAYFLNNDCYSWTDREFDSSGHPIKEISYDLRGAVCAGWDEYEYDGLGRVAEKISCDESGEPQYRHEYEYDDHGNPVKDTSYDCWNETLFETVVWEYAYDSKGRLIRETCTTDADDWYDIEYGYDDVGNLLWEVHYKPDGSVDYRYDYEYMTITVYKE